MRKLLIFSSLLFLLMLSPPSFADVGIKQGVVGYGTATDLNVRGQNYTSDGSTFTMFLLSTGTSDGSTTMLSTDTAVPLGYSLVRKHLSSSTQVNLTLANGTPGQVLTITISEVDSSGTAYLRPTTKTGFLEVFFDAARDSVTLLYVNDTVGWIIIGQNSVVVGG